MPKKKISITLDAELIDRIDAARGMVNRSKYLNALLTDELIAFKLDDIYLLLLDDRRGDLTRADYARQLVVKAVEGNDDE